MNFRENHKLTAIAIPGTTREIVVLGKGDEAKRALVEKFDELQRKGLTGA